MRPATKHWLLLVFLAVSLAIMVAITLWQIGKARREGAVRTGGSQSLGAIS
jgi:CHASE3 domain sensor protein